MGVVEGRSHPGQRLVVRVRTPRRPRQACWGGGVGGPLRRWLAKGSAAADKTRPAGGAIRVRFIATVIVDNAQELPEQRRCHHRGPLRALARPGKSRLENLSFLQTSTPRAGLLAPSLIWQSLPGAFRRTPDASEDAHSQEHWPAALGLQRAPPRRRLSATRGCAALCSASSGSANISAPSAYTPSTPHGHYIRTRARARPTPSCYIATTSLVPHP